MSDRVMSALGHKRTCAVQLGMSALCCKRTSPRLDAMAQTSVNNGSVLNAPVC